MKYLPLLPTLCSALESYAFFEDSQGLKSIKQIEKPYETVKEAFSLSTTDSLADNWHRNIFMLKDGKELAAYVQISLKDSYYELPRRQKYSPFINVFCVTVAPKYKGQGLSYRIFVNGIEQMKEHYGLDGNTLIALHLNPRDKDMAIAMRSYYKLGFRRGVFCKYGPLSFQYRIDALFRNARDVYDIAENPEICRTEGGFLLAYCHLKDFNKNYSLPPDALEKGRKMVEVLRGRTVEEL